MIITRLRRACVTLVVAGLVFVSSGACATGKNHCKPATATFPISGIVVKKEMPEKNCYVLHVRRDGTTSTETVHVSRYRYLHVESRSTVTYPAQPTD